MTSWRKALQAEDGRARRGLEWTSSSLIILASGTMPLEVTAATGTGLSRAIWWLDVGVLTLFTGECILRLRIAERPLKYALSPYGLDAGGHRSGAGDALRYDPVPSGL